MFSKALLGNEMMLLVIQLKYNNNNYTKVKSGLRCGYNYQWEIKTYLSM
ncbi:hypothetical protein SAMN05518872_11528 [Psychrobacillus sp. OK032]|nr:hypothetical protein SAMN05518872_11528 [Psychrobacillus sp. OK032]